MPFETDKSGGFKIDASELLKTGVYPERFDRKIPFWETVDGVQYTEFGMRRKAGREQIKDYKESPFGSNTPMRGIVATREYDTRVVYSADLNNIYSFWEQDISAGGAQKFDTVGTGYNLLRNSQGTTWDSSLTTWDDSGTTWDSSVNESDQWDFETFGSFVVGAKGSSKPVIKKNNVNFNTYYNDEVSGASVTAGGLGYAVDDTITGMTDGGTPADTFAIKVTKVDGGAITAFEITNFGSGISNGQVISAGTTSGGGNGNFTCTVTVPQIDFDTLECFHRQGPHMLAFSYSKGDVDYSTSFAWCSADDLDTWTAAATNTAGSLLIREAETPIRCVAQLGNGLAVYTETQMFIVNYVGQPNIFGYKVALENGVGAVSPNSVISVGRMNYGVSRDGFFATDGASVRMIGRESGMNQYFRDNMAMGELAQVYGFENSKENEVVWGVPKDEASITEEIYYNYKTNQWGIRTSIISAYLDRGVFHEALSADSNGNLYFEGNTPNNTNPDSQATQPVSAVTKAHDLNNADRVKEITAIRVGKEGSGSPRMSIGWSNTIDADPTYLDKDSFLIDDSFKSFPIRAAGRYIHIKVESTGASDDWTLTDLVVQGRYEGER